MKKLILTSLISIACIASFGQQGNIPYPDLIGVQLDKIKKMFTGYEINAANGATLLEYEDKDENGKTLLHSYYFFKDNLCYKIDLYPADEVGIYSFIGWFDNEYNKAKDGVWLILNNQENIIKVTFESDNHGVFFSYVRYD